MNIKNTLITDDLNKIDFAKLNEGQQIFLLTEKINEDTKYNDLTVYYLKNKRFDMLYSFDIINLNIDISYDGYSSNEMNWDACDDIISYLRINKNFIQVDLLDRICNINETLLYEENIIEQFKELYLRNEIISDKTISQSKKRKYTYTKYSNEEEINEYKIKYYATINLNSCILGIYISYNFQPELYNLDKNIKLFLFDNEFKTFGNIEISYVQELINALKNNFKCSSINNCINNLSTYTFTINNIKHDTKLKNIVYETFKDINFENHNIDSIMNQFILPIYQDKELTAEAYIQKYQQHFLSTSALAYNYPQDLCNDKIEKFKKKAIATFYFKSKRSLIDIYTGELLIDYSKTAKVHIFYEDAQFLYVLINGNSFIYEKIDGIYTIIENSREKINVIDEIEKRKKLCVILSN